MSVWLSFVYCCVLVSLNFSMARCLHAQRVCMCVCSSVYAFVWSYVCMFGFLYARMRVCPYVLCVIVSLCV